MRKPSAAVLLAILVIGALAGCSTPGPVHLYSLPRQGAEIHDRDLSGTDTARAVPSYLGEGEVVTGFAYDPFTDHFFLRLAPGDHIRVVDRPARKIKREFTLDSVARGGGDVAVSPRDGHLYLVDPAAPQLLETSRLGVLIRRVPLEGRTKPAAAVAYDPARSRLIILDQDGRTIDIFSPEGRKLGRYELAATVLPSIAYDGDGRQLFAPLGEKGTAIGVFDDAGKQIRTLPLADGDVFIEVGPHSFFRMF